MADNPIPPSTELEKQTAEPIPTLPDVYRFERSWQPASKILRDLGFFDEYYPPKESLEAAEFEKGKLELLMLSKTIVDLDMRQKITSQAPVLSKQLYDILDLVPDDDWNKLLLAISELPVSFAIQLKKILISLLHPNSNHLQELDPILRSFVEKEEVYKTLGSVINPDDLRQQALGMVIEELLADKKTQYTLLSYKKPSSDPVMPSSKTLPAGTFTASELMGYYKLGPADPKYRATNNYNRSEADFTAKDYNVKGFGGKAKKDQQEKSDKRPPKPGYFMDPRVIMKLAYVVRDSVSDNNAKVAIITREMVEKKLQFINSIMQPIIETGVSPEAARERVKEELNFIKYIRKAGFSEEITREKLAELHLHTLIENGVSANSFLARLQGQGYNPRPVDVDNAFKEFKEQLPSDLPNDQMCSIQTSHGNIDVLFHLIVNKRVLLADPEQMQKYFLAKYPQPDISIPKGLFGVMLEAYIGQGKNDFLGFLEIYGYAQRFSNEGLARDLEVSSETLSGWKRKEIIDPGTVSKIVTKHSLTDKQHYLLLKLGRASIRDKSITDLLAEARKKLAVEDLSSKDRAKICGELLHSLIKVTGTPIKNIANKTNVSESMVHHWCKSFNPLHNISKTDILGEIFAGGKGPLAIEIADTLLGLLERKPPEQLLKEYRSNTLRVEELLLQARLNNRGVKEITTLAEYIGLQDPEEYASFFSYLNLNTYGKAKRSRGK